MSKDKAVSVDNHSDDLIERLSAALIEGEQSGEPAPFDLADFLDDMHRDRDRAAP